jgi:triosephosphate isomerase (TIM)
MKEISTTMRTPIIAGNWKMNTTVDEAMALAEQMKDLDKLTTSVDVVFCPPFVSIHALKWTLRGTALGLGAQNMYMQEKGAFTGEISPVMLAALCKYVILGHSERRQYFKETDEFINQKVKLALKHSLIPIVCVGETLAQYEANETDAVVTSQVTGVLHELSAEQVKGLVIAYEPVWAIGTGRAATAEIAQNVCARIRAIVRKLYDQPTADAVRVQYGGSVTAANVAEIISQPDIDGALVGGASLKAADFAVICQKSAELKGKK